MALLLGHLLPEETQTAMDSSPMLGKILIVMIMMQLSTQGLMRCVMGKTIIVMAW